MRAITRKRGPRPYPRRRLNPALRRRVYDFGRPLWQLARELGFRHPARFSHLINAKTIPSSRESLAQLCRIANAVGFDSAQLFV